MRKFLSVLLLVIPGLFAHLVAAQNNDAPQPFAVWSSDGQALALVSSDQLSIFHAGQLNPVILAAEKYFSAASFSESGALLATWDDSQVVRIWNTETGEQIAQRSYADGLGSVGFLGFFAGDQTLVFSYADRTWFMYGKRLSHPLSPKNDNEALPTATPHTYITQRSGVYLWDYHTTDNLHIVPLSSNPSEYALALSNDQSKLVSVRYDSQNRTGFLITYSRVTSVQSGDIIGYLGGFTARLRQVKFDPVNSSFVAMLSEDGIVRISDFTEQIRSLTLSLLRNRIRTIAYSLDGKTLATGGVDGKVRLWDTETGAMLEVYPNQLADVDQLAFESTGELLAFGDPLFYPRVWNAKTLATISDFRPQSPPTPTPSLLPTLVPGG